jgi:hypothetical protein
MATKWVDNGDYFGPDRRRRPGKRLLDRRRHDEAGQPPSVGALLRRLRVRIGGSSADDRHHALEMVKAAIDQAHRLGWQRCAEALIAADEALRIGGADAAHVADAHVVQALDHAGSGR